MTFRDLRKRLAQWIAPIERDNRGVAAVEYLEAQFNKDYAKLYTIFRTAPSGQYVPNEFPTSDQDKFIPAMGDPLYSFGRVIIDRWIAEEHPNLLDVKEGTPLNDAVMLRAIKELTSER